jgi:hypothetical protein
MVGFRLRKVTWMQMGGIPEGRQEAGVGVDESLVRRHAGSLHRSQSVRFCASCKLTTSVFSVIQVLAALQKDIREMEKGSPSLRH